MKHGAYEDHGGPYLVLDPRLAITVRSSTGELEWEGMGTLSVMTNVDNMTLDGRRRPRVTRSHGHGPVPVSPTFNSVTNRPPLLQRDPAQS
jgi:hypothetical protein